jgi:hypothetical protein
LKAPDNETELMPKHLVIDSVAEMIAMMDAGGAAPKISAEGRLPFAFIPYIVSNLTGACPWAAASNRSILGTPLR